MENKERLIKLTKIAEEALEKYNLEGVSFSFFREDTNVFFEVDHGDKKYMLKICQEESSKLEDNLAEIFFLDLVIKNTDFKVPVVIHSKTGERVIKIPVDGEEDKRIILYEYLDGDEFYGNESYEYFEKLGEKMALLHNLSEDVIIPDTISPKKWDKIFYFRDEPVVYNDKEYEHITSKEDRELLDKFVVYADEQLKNYYSGKSFIIHGDINPWNVKIHEGEIRMLDFEDSILGNEIHDLSILLYYYQNTKGLEYDKVKEYVYKGYQKLRMLPNITEFDLQFLYMARNANFVNYVLYIDEEPGDYFKRNMEKIRQFIKTYNIEL